MPAVDLSAAFDVRRGSIVTAVGGGGKTSLVFRLAREAADRGERAVVATTTKFTVPGEQGPLVYAEGGEAAIHTEVERTAAPGTVLIAHSGRGARGRLMGFTADVAGQIPGDVVAIEGDGSAHRPFKAPDAHEPVIPPQSTHVVVCVGLEVLGQPLAEERVHRAKLVAALTSARPGSPVVADMIVDVLLHPDGGRKGVPPGTRLMALLNAPRTEEHRRLGDHIGARLVYGGFERAIVATAHAGAVHSLVR